MSEAYKPLDPETMPRSPGITYQQLLDQDSRPVPDVLRLQSPRDMGLQRYSVKRYTSAAWHELEVERLWKKFGSLRVEKRIFRSLGTTTGTILPGCPS